MPDNFKAIAKRLSELEGGKKQINIAQISEMLSVLGYMLFENPMLIVALLRAGQKRKNRLK